MEKIELEVGNVLRGIVPSKIENSRKSGEVFEYSVEHPRIDSENSRFILFPGDEIIALGQKYDAIITAINNKYTPRIILSAVYHDFQVGDEVLVKISKTSEKRGQPMFVLSGYLGFVINGKAKEGDMILAKVKKRIHSDRMDILETKVTRVFG